MAILDFTTLFHDRGAARGIAELSKNFEKAAGSATDLETATKRLAISEAKAADAAGQMRVAEARMDAVRKNAKTTSVQRLQAEENLARSQRRLVSAQNDVKVSSDRVAASQKHVRTQLQQSAVQAQNTDSRMRRAVGGLRAFGSAGVSATGRVIGGFKAVGVGAAGVATGILAAAVAPVMFGLKTAAAMENAEIAFTTMLGSARKARVFLGELQRFAAKTPFEFPELQKAASSLISVGISAKNVIPIMKTLGNVTSGMGTGSEGVQRATVALQQMSAAGKISAEDLNQLRDAGIPTNVLFEAMAKKLGTTSKKLFEMRTNGELGKKELEALMAVLQSGKGFERFNGLMDKQSKSLNGMLSTLKDTFGQGMANALKGSLPFLKQGIGALTEEMGKVFKVIDDHQGDIKEVFRSIKRAMKEIDTDELVAGIADVIEALPGIVAQLDTVIKKWQQFSGAVEKFENATGKKEGGPLGGMVNAVTRNIKRLGNAIEGGWDRMTAWVVTKTGEMRDKVVHWFKTMGHEAASSFKRDSGQVIDSAKNMVSKVIDRIAALPGKAKAALRSLAAKIGSEFEQAKDTAIRKTKDLVNRAVDFISRLPGRAKSALSSLASQVGSEVEQAKDTVVRKARDMVTRFIDRMQDMVRQAREQAGRVKGAIVDRFNGARDWLMTAGRNVIRGLGDGLRVAFDAVKRWVGGIAKWIKAHKGPVSLDRQLLVPAGKALMGGLLEGLKFGFGGVGDFVFKAGSKVSDIIGQIKKQSFLGDWTGKIGSLKGGGNKLLNAIRNMFHIGGGTYPGHGERGASKAWDFMIHSKAQGNAIAAFAKHFARQLGVMYVIWNKRIWSVQRNAQGWRPYTRYGSSGSPSQMHTNHVHVSLFDKGGMLRGLGINTTGQPERVLSPGQTKSFDRLVQVLDRGHGAGGNTYVTVNAPNGFIGSQDQFKRMLVDMNRRGELQVIKNR